MSFQRVMLASTFLLGTATLAAQTSDRGVLGEWKEPGGTVIRVAQCGTDVCARIIALAHDVPSTTDGRNPDPSLRSRALCGLQIGSAFHLNDPTTASNGKLYDPKTGKTYSGSMASAGDTLNLRCYVGLKMFGRTESWTRVHNVVPCTANAGGSAAQ